ncbi:MAG: hypothetical protein HY519_00660, partial [Candidatus Aenigmarchaeota archaeon]|nr:hypothetical protein [Candidatus Aenigmarchaeota archaeon]
GILVNKQCRCIDIAQAHGIPLIYNDRKGFLGGNAAMATGQRLADYDQLNLKSIRALEQEKGFQTDLICLAGYWAILRKPLLDAFAGRIINSHPADLTALDNAGKRKYANVYGWHAAMAAIGNGEQHTKTCIILATREVDEGPILVTSQPLAFAKKLDSLKRLPDGPAKQQALQEFAGQHQELQKKACDFPAYLKALELIAAGRLALGTGTQGKNKTMYLDGKPLPYGGYQL